MGSPEQNRTRLFATIVRIACAAWAIAFLLTVVSTPAAHAQTFNVIYTFTGGSDGANPSAGLTIDAAGNLYGTAFTGGSGYGTVFTLKPSGSDWIMTPLYDFRGGDDGAGPVARITLGADGSLYGSTSAGGAGDCRNHGGYNGCGTIFNLRPSVGACQGVLCGLSEIVLHHFEGNDGAYPQGDLTFDQAGKLYGTTINGGSTGYGVVYSLTPNQGSWRQNVLYEVQNGNDGAFPWGGVVFDRSGKLHGVLAHNGLTGYGTVFQLTPSGSSWVESNMHGFTFGNDGAIPQGGLMVDSSGNIYGTTVYGGSGGGGTVFELSPSGQNWSYHVMHALSGGIDLGPYDKLAMDAAGNLYGTTYADGSHNSGTVFKLSYSHGNWTYTVLHNFTGGSDGAYPFSTLVFDGDGNLYGTTSYGGANDDGVVFKITP